MTVKLNQRAYEHAKRLIKQGRFTNDEREAWSDHHPSTRTENEFIEEKGFFEYGKWFLGINDKYKEETMRHYELRYGDFGDVHRCGILTAQARACQNKSFDIENAAADLLAAIDKQARRSSVQ